MGAMRHHTTGDIAMTDSSNAPDKHAKLRNTMVLKDLQLPEDVDVEVKGGSITSKYDQSANNVIRNIRG
jgi:hypothetical protein